MNRRYVSPGSSLHGAPARLVEALAWLRNRKPSCSAWRMWKRPVTAQPPSSISSRRSSPGKDETRNPVQDVLQASDDQCPNPNLIWVRQIALLGFGDPPQLPAVLVNRDRASAHRLGLYHMKSGRGNPSRKIIRRTSRHGRKADRKPLNLRMSKRPMKRENLGGDADSDPSDPTPNLGLVS